MAKAKQENTASDSEQDNISVYQNTPFCLDAAFKQIASIASLTVQQVENVVTLLQGDATIPFIARYRKELTGSLDEVAITTIRDTLHKLQELDSRRQAILKSLTERNLLTPELDQALQQAETLAELEDIYLPYRPKRRTRATIARESGLEPLALTILTQDPSIVPEQIAQNYIDADKNVPDIDAALQGSRDIIAEIISEDATTRSELRDLFWNQGTIISQVIAGKEESGAKFSDYFDATELIKSVPSHRLLALFRGEKEEVLKLTIRPSQENALDIIFDIHVKNKSLAADQVIQAATDSYSRLIAPSLETELRNLAKEIADTEAIRVFSANLRELLLASPLGQKRVLGIDPGFRTGCKVVVLNEQGKLLEDTVIYPTTGAGAQREAGNTVCHLVSKYQIQAIAIGNGTASRETEQFVRKLGLSSDIAIIVVNESGASIYSASEVAREEFPDKDITVRGAVSIARRLMDPLAELVKIDPKSIGVGQYQHDVDQSLLKQALDDVVINAVNAVGVDVNTASKQLLSYVSGLGPKLADNIIIYRNENGPFKTRQALRKVPRLGPKAFEQAAGFLRIQGGDNLLDSSAVHPERYKLVETMAKDIGASLSELLTNPEKRQQINLTKYVAGDVGMPTLQDIMSELKQPGRDPRQQFTVFSFADGINEVDDLQPGQKLPGIVTNVVNFGAFVDIGVHQDGLVHVSEIADKFVANPADFLKVGQQVVVTVLNVDKKRNRVSLSMKTNPRFARE